MSWEDVLSLETFMPFCSGVFGIPENHHRTCKKFTYSLHREVLQESQHEFRKATLTLNLHFVVLGLPNPRKLKFSVLVSNPGCSFHKPPQHFGEDEGFFWPVNPQADAASCSEGSDDLGHVFQNYLFSVLCLPFCCNSTE